VLNLAFNKLTGIRALKCCPNIAKLDLSYNLLTNVDYITDLKKLEILFLHFNNIANVKLLEDFNYLTHLKELRIKGNPIALESGYRYPIVQMLTNLRVLDQVVITKLDREGVN
jgi:Leucine-rich repeat (LRR) protein